MIGLVLRSLRYFWRTNLGVLLGATCAAAVLVGAMAVGDSVRMSLRNQAEARIGSIDAALHAGDRHFRSSLADRFATDMPGTIAPVLRVPGIARMPDGGNAAGSGAGIVEVLGVDERFFALSPSGRSGAPPAGKAWVNERLAQQLGVGPGDSILLRIEKPSILPRDMLMSTVDDISFALRAQVDRVVSQGEFGSFGLHASQVQPFNVFVALPWLQERLELPDRANMLLLGAPEHREDPLSELATMAVRRHWTLADMELRVEKTGDLEQLASDRVFLDRPIVEAVQEITPDGLGILTYFVNAIRAGEKSTPYSTIAAIGPLGKTAPSDPTAQATLALVPRDLGPDEIALNDWTARDLGVVPKSEVRLEYFYMGANLKLETATQTFRVHSVRKLEAAAADPTLMPEFPGIADSENCRDWEPGVPVDLDKIRDTDEKYWDEHRGTPKGFVTLATGQKLWSSRFGNLTAIRAPAGFAERVAKMLPEMLDPAALGMFFRDVRTPALDSGTSATDFGGLFLGLSFFLILAALLLTSLLFAFGVEQRANEIGTLLAIGFRPGDIRQLFLLESLVLATIGSLLGALLGLGYTRGVLYGLDTLWRDAVGSTTLSFHAPLGTVALGTVISIVVAVVAIAITLRRVFDRPALELLTSRSGIPAVPVSGSANGRTSLWLAIACPILAITLVLFVAGSASEVAGAFFGAGALLLIGALAISRRVLTRFAGSTTHVVDSVAGLGVRNSGRRPGRSLATVALLASGTFLVVAVQANRLEPPREPSIRTAGTGGFAFIGRSTLPVLRDLGSPEGREKFGLTEDSLKEVAIVPMRVREGDDASCLNLSLAQNPRLVGVLPAALASRQAFAFADTVVPEGTDTTLHPWALLDADYGPNVVPAIGDAASITWALHLAVGDTLDYVDDRGETFQVKIVGAVANSILQGNLLIAESHMQRRFPSATGYRMFLVDAPAARANAVKTELTTAFEDIGMELTSTSDRLREFNAVQNTYLLIFQVLGGLGLLLGSIGVGMVVLRNALERRSELAVVAALGYAPKTVRKLVWSEHSLLLALGLGSGVLAALLAVLPGSARDVSITPMLVVVLGVALSGALWVFLASMLATRGPLLSALQED